ncbi:MAG: sigma-54 dependent transcriptional regulator [Nannocystaceae bacterium]
MSAPSQLRVFLVISQPSLRGLLQALLEPLPVMVSEAVDADDGWRRLPTERHDLVLLDGTIEPARVREWIERIRRGAERAELVVFAQAIDRDRRAELLSVGCLAVLEAGITRDVLASTVRSLVRRCRGERGRSASAGFSRHADAAVLVADSAAMRTILATASRLATTHSPVLLLGETGVGKERIAALIHAEGPWARGPFVEVNCAAIPAELFESELFGHERGAFTGATRTRRGRFELADQGTLFLDEVGEVPLHLQAKLLRVLQSRRIEPVGSERSVEINVRVIAATNRDLRAEVEAGRFRRDLFYRLSVVELEVPPLRERVEDIDGLTHTYLELLSAQLGGAVTGIDAAALEALHRYPWPGNVRELVNVVERAILMCPGDTITRAELPESVAYGPASAPREPSPRDPTKAEQGQGVQIPAAWLDRPWKEVREALLAGGERAYLEGLLARAQGRIGVAAARAGLAPRSLFEKMRRHGLRKEDYRGP